MIAARRLVELQRAFVAPAGAGQSRPRNVALTAKGRVLFTTAAVLFAASLAAGSVLYGVAARQDESRRTIEATGLVTNGEVSRLWANGDDRRRVAYRFRVDGRTFEGNVRVSEERRRTLQVGSPVAVRYLPSNPTVNDLGGQRRGMPLVVPFLVASALAAGGVIALGVLARQRALLGEGRLAPAIVTGHAKNQDSYGGTHRTMTYQFALLSGAVASGSSGTSSKPPGIGSVITVIYDPDRPKRNAVYPLTLVKPAR